MNRFWQETLVKILTGLSPVILDSMRKGVRQLDEQARKTSNPVDDIFTGLLRSIVGDPKED